MAPVTRSVGRRQWGQTTGIGISRSRRRRGQRRSDQRELVAAAAVGEEAVVAHPHQPLGQDMEQEAAHELAAVEGQRLVAPTFAVVAIAQRDVRLIDCEDAPRVAREVIDDGGRVLEAVPGVDDPLGGHQRIEHDVDFAEAGDAVQLAGAGRPLRAATMRPRKRRDSPRTGNR